MERSSELTRPGIVWFAVINIILFQNPLLKVTSLFKYTDECLMLFFAAWIATHGKKLHRSYVAIAVLSIALVYLGLLGNTFSGISRPRAAILLDIANFAKLFVTAIGAALYFEETDVGQTGLLRLTAHEVRLIVTAGAALAALSQFVNLGMTHGVRFGIKAFQFFFSTPGMLNQYCIIYLLILTLDLRGSADKRFKFPFILLAFALWLSTGRTRGFAVIAVWTIVMLLANNEVFGDGRIRAEEKIKRFFRPQYLLAVAAGLLLIGWDQLEYYLGGGTVTARGLLLRGGITAMKEFWPLGAGYATFGTEQAAKYYSPLYYRYGLNTFWALAEGGTELTDCYWPAVGAQFGIFGLLIMAALVALLSAELIRISGTDKYALVSMIVYVIYLLISSTATGIYTAYTTTGFVTVLTALSICRSKGIGYEDSSII